jgi:hypothetical protein
MSYAECFRITDYLQIIRSTRVYAVPGARGRSRKAGLCQAAFHQSFTGPWAMAHPFAVRLHIPAAAGHHAHGFASERENRLV